MCSWKGFQAKQARPRGMKPKGKAGSPQASAVGDVTSILAWMDILY